MPLLHYCPVGLPPFAPILLRAPLFPLPPITYICYWGGIRKGVLNGYIFYSTHFLCVEVSLRPSPSTTNVELGTVPFQLMGKVGTEADLLLHIRVLGGGPIYRQSLNGSKTYVRLGSLFNSFNFVRHYF